MAEIKILDESISNIIAAGEVVENPASMIKELLENSLDANSTKIDIEVLSGGSYVKISDNGKGMSKEDVLLSIERHATSKISEKDDIFNLTTYGFRGEALASISSVSKISISSKREVDKIGTILNSYGGIVRKYEDISRTTGTDIEIRDLFYNTPARKKFLRKDSTEYTKIKDIVLKEALANPNVAISLNIEGKSSIKTTGNGMESTIFEIFGKNILKNLTKFKYGYLGNVEILRSSKEYIYTYVNGRYVKSNVIDRAVIDGYYTKLMKGKYPFAIINYNINPKEIDVNVHPSKKLVKFSDEKYVYGDIKNSIDDFFYEYDRKNWQPVLQPKVENNVEYTYTEKNIDENINDKSNSYIYEESYLKSIDYKFEFTENTYSDNNQVKLNEETKIEENIVKDNKVIEEIKEEDNGYLKGFFEREVKIDREYNVLGQIFDTYILVEGEEELEIYDQHIIHERLLYEELMEAYSKKELSQQTMLIPELITLTPLDKDIVLNNIEVFRSLAFDIDDIGENNIILRAYPNFTFRESIVNIIYKIIEDLKINDKVRDIRERIIISMSCRGAIKAGQKLNIEEMKNMVKRLHSVGKYTCPHGRPIITKISKYFLDKNFGRVK